MSSLHFYVRTACSYKNLNLNSYFFAAKFHRSKSLCCSHMIESCLHWEKVMFVRRFPREQRKLSEKKKGNQV